MATLGTVKINLHLTTEIGGPITLAEGSLEVPLSSRQADDHLEVTVDESVLRHELAVALRHAATQLEDVPDLYGVTP